MMTNYSIPHDWDIAEARIDKGIFYTPRELYHLPIKFKTLRFIGNNTPIDLTFLVGKKIRYLYIRDSPCFNLKKGVELLHNPSLEAVSIIHPRITSISELDTLVEYCIENRVKVSKPFEEYTHPLIGDHPLILDIQDRDKVDGGWSLDQGRLTSVLADVTDKHLKYDALFTKRRYCDFTNVKKIHDFRHLFLTGVDRMLNESHLHDLKLHSTTIGFGAKVYDLSRPYIANVSRLVITSATVINHEALLYSKVLKRVIVDDVTTMDGTFLETLSDLKAKGIGVFARRVGGDFLWYR